MKIGAIHQQLPARRQPERLPQPVERRAEPEPNRSVGQPLLTSDLQRPMLSVGKQRAIDFYIITAAISGASAEGELIGVDTFA